MRSWRPSRRERRRLKMNKWQAARRSPSESAGSWRMRTRMKTVSLVLSRRLLRRAQTVVRSPGHDVSMKWEIFNLMSARRWGGKSVDIIWVARRRRKVKAILMFINRTALSRDHEGNTGMKCLSTHMLIFVHMRNGYPGEISLSCCPWPRGTVSDPQ